MWWEMKWKMWIYKLYAHATKKQNVCSQCSQAKRLSQEHINIPGHLEIPHIFVGPQQHPGITQEITSDLKNEGTD